MCVCVCVCVCVRQEREACDSETRHEAVWEWKAVRTALFCIVQLVRTYRYARIGLDWVDWIGLVQYTVELKGSYERGNELSVSIKCWKFIDWLRYSSLLKRDSAPKIGWLQQWSEELDGRVCSTHGVMRNGCKMFEDVKQTKLFRP